MSPIPLSKDFIEALSTIEITFSSEGEVPGLLIRDAQSASTASGQRYLSPAISLVKIRDSNISAESVIKKIQTHLSSNEHPNQIDIAGSILALSIIAGKDGNARVKLLNQMIESISDANVTHFLTISTMPSKHQFTFKGFKVGHFEYDHFFNLCNKAQSDYAELYCRGMRGYFAIQSPVYKRKVVDVIPILKESLQLGDEIHEVLKEAILTYYEKITRIYYEKMWDDLEEVQHIITALDKEIIVVESWKNMPIGERVSVYLNLSGGGYGYVVPEGRTLNINTPPPDGEIFQNLKVLEAEFNLSNLGDSELANTIKTFSRYVYKGLLEQRIQKHSESALNYFIALELLFSEKSATQDKVCGRTAVFLHRSSNLKFEQAYKRNIGLYDVRSKYVHKGVAIKKEVTEEAELMVKQVLRNLLCLNMNPRTKDPDFLENWIKQLDWIRASFEAGRTIPLETFQENGIAL